MRFSRIFIIGGAWAVCAAARAVYAPIPDQEQGKELTVSVGAGIAYDNNIFGAYTQAISSTIFQLSPSFVFNASLNPETFLSADYKLGLDYYLNRPGEKLLDNHAVDARLAHAFSKVTILDLSDSFIATRDPASLLSGEPINADQSYLSNSVDGRMTMQPTEKIGLILKARDTYYDYYNALLANELNRFEDLFGVEANYALLPDLKAAAEYRHSDVDYVTNGSSNNKHSEFLMAGADYTAGPRLTASFRVGAEWRRLAVDGNQTAPHAEVSAKYDYAKGSFVSVGYGYDLAETSDPVHYVDEKTNRIFINVQHALTAKIVASASVDYEPSRLIGVIGQPDVNETTTHTGAALTYLPDKNWAVSATYDYDYTDSGVVFRGMNRSRTGLNCRYTF